MVRDLSMFECIAAWAILTLFVLAVACGAGFLVWWLASTFSPVQFGVGVGAVVAAMMGLMFYSAVRG